MPRRCLPQTSSDWSPHVGHAVIGAGCAGGRKKLKSYEGVQKLKDWAKRELKEEFTEISSRNNPMA